MKIVTETAAKYSSPRFEEAELNARSQKASGSEHVSPGTSDETRTAGTIPPPVLIPRRARELPAS